MTRLRDLCVDDARQKLYLEAGLGPRETGFARGLVSVLSHSEDPAQLAGETSGMDWVKPFADGLGGDRGTLITDARNIVNSELGGDISPAMPRMP